MVMAFEMHACSPLACIIPAAWLEAPLAMATENISLEGLQMLILEMMLDPEGDEPDG